MDLITKIRTAFESSFKNSVLQHTPDSIVGLKEMVEYHFGWNNPVSVPGKRLRPLFLILTYSALGGEPEDAFHQAAAMETLHNFTLVHDDIQDNGLTRHGQTALWCKFGMPLAINVGDYLSNLSHRLMSIRNESIPYKNRENAITAFQNASLEVIQGQQLDISYENYKRISVDDYLGMIRLKTSRLFAGSMRIGASLKGVDAGLIDQLDSIGEKLGLGFQIQDDYLGIWGKTGKTGKSVSTDLTTRKKAYPALIGLEKSPEFAKIWDKPGDISDDDLVKMKSNLEEIGADQQTLSLAKNHYQEAKVELSKLLPASDPYTQAFLDLIDLMFAPSN
ncbi:MAG: polyprenyl synthetase family protein [Anaerolineaceae bacterium]|jgi:geranylgeranyl diphosphate synthase type I